MINVLVADDSAFMRQIFKKTINRDPDLNVVDTARNGKDAIRKTQNLNPDVITLDIEMPEKNGIQTLKQILEENPNLPVIMISAIDNKKTIVQALEIGAFDFIPKPSGNISLNIDSIEKDIIKKIKAAYKSSNQKTKLSKQKEKQSNIITGQKKFSLVAVGTSSGGPRALKKLIKKFPEKIPAALLIVQHMPEGFTESLARHLNQEAGFPIKEAKEGDKITPGEGLVAPGNYHLEINQNKVIELNQKPKKWGVRPCIDYMMISAARVYKEQLIGVILTGMGHDGAQGMEEIKKYNGYGIVESRKTALVHGMPSSTIKKNAYDTIQPLGQIPKTIMKLLKGEN
ncbi:MAG: chemotaxis-specific protein-glutamate methyltransferase CheB [bacterium]